jgi:hypothetical protein
MTISLAYVIIKVGPLVPPVEALPPAVGGAVRAGGFGGRGLVAQGSWPDELTGVAGMPGRPPVTRAAAPIFTCTSRAWRAAATPRVGQRFATREVRMRMPSVPRRRHPEPPNEPSGRCARVDPADLRRCGGYGEIGFLDEPSELGQAQLGQESHRRSSGLGHKEARQVRAGDSDRAGEFRDCPRVGNTKPEKLNGLTHMPNCRGFCESPADR